MIGLIKDVKNILTQTFKQAEDLIYVVGETRNDFSGSLIQKVQQKSISGTIAFDIEEEYQNQKFVQRANEDGFLESAHDLSEGGLAAGLMESVFSTPFGFKVKTSLTNGQLFSETQSRFVISVKKENQTKFEQYVSEDFANLSVKLLGEVTSSGEITVTTDEATISFNREVIESKWKEVIPCLLNA